MFWSLYSIFFPSSLGWILRGNSRCVNSFPSSSGLRNACGTKQGAQPWCQERGPASIAHPLGCHRPPGTPNHTGQPARQPAGKWGGGNIGCSDPNASRERCRSLRATLLSYTHGEEQLEVATPTLSKDTSSPKTHPGCGRGPGRGARSSTEHGARARTPTGPSCVQMTASAPVSIVTPCRAVTVLLPPRDPALGPPPQHPAGVGLSCIPQTPPPCGPQHALSQAAPAKPCASSPGASPSTACRHQGSGRCWKMQVEEERS